MSSALRYIAWPGESLTKLRKKSTKSPISEGNCELQRWTSSQSSEAVLTEGPGVIFWSAARERRSLDLAFTASGDCFMSDVKAARRTDLEDTMSASASAATVSRSFALASLTSSRSGGSV